MPCRTQHSQSQGGPRGSPPAPGSGAEGQTVRWVTGRGQLQGSHRPPHLLSRTDWHLHLCHTHTRKGTHHCLHTCTEQTQSRTWTCIYAVTRTLPHTTRHTCVCIHMQSPTATHPWARGIAVSTIPGAQTSTCNPTSTPTQTPRGITQIPASTVTDGRWHPGASPPAQPRHFPPAHQVLGRLGQHSKGGQVLALAAGVGCLGLQGLAALSVPVP